MNLTPYPAGPGYQSMVTSSDSFMLWRGLQNRVTGMVATIEWAFFAGLELGKCSQ